MVRYGKIWWDGRVRDSQWSTFHTTLLNLQVCVWRNGRMIATSNKKRLSKSQSRATCAARHCPSLWVGAAVLKRKGCRWHSKRFRSACIEEYSVFIVWITLQICGSLRYPLFASFELIFTTLCPPYVSLVTRKLNDALPCPHSRTVLYSYIIF